MIPSKYLTRMISSQIGHCNFSHEHACSSHKIIIWLLKTWNSSWVVQMTFMIPLCAFFVLLKLETPVLHLFFNFLKKSEWLEHSSKCYSSTAITYNTSLVCLTSKWYRSCPKFYLFFFLLYQDAETHWPLSVWPLVNRSPETDVNTKCKHSLGFIFKLPTHDLVRLQNQ